MKSSLFITILVCFSAFNSINAATIVVDGTDGTVADDGICSISEAILSANTDTVQFASMGECLAGSGADTIQLSNNITLTQEYPDTDEKGRTGTPKITSTIMLDGQGFVLQRDNTNPCNLNGSSEIGEIRLLRNDGGNLSLKNITLAYGCADFSNQDPISSGGGIYNAGTLSLLDTTFDQNKAQYEGGAMFHEIGTISKISNSTFSENLTNLGSGGAIYFQSKITTIENSTFSGNSSTIGTGGIDQSEFTTVTNIQNSTFSGNINGAIYIGGNMIIQNSLFHNNSGTECLDDSGQSGTFTVINNISTNSSSDCHTVANTLTPSTLAPLADNGGPTQTHALLVNSEAINAGDINSTTTDQRGMAANAIRDIGAYEYYSAADLLCPIPLRNDGFNTTVSTADDLIQAIECANLNGEANGGDTIRLGTDINLTQDYDDDLVLGYTGTPVITSTITLDGQDHILQRDSIVECNIDGTSIAGEFRLLRNDNGNLTLQNITLANGCADKPKQHGGALYNAGNLSVIKVIFTQNKAAIGSGIIHTLGTISEITSSTFTANPTTISAALYMNSGTINTIQNSVFDGNDSSQGAAITLFGGDIGTIQNSSFSNNSARAGGAIHVGLGTISNILNCTFSNNTALFKGGAISNLIEITTIQNSTFFNNSANDGGAIYNQTTINTIQNTTFSGNTAINNGDAIYNTNAINNLQNSLFHNNGSNDCVNTSVLNGSNNISDNAASSCPGIILNILDPLTVDNLANNGGPTMTHALLAESQAIDQGDMDATSTDQRGFDVIIIRDIGAYEFNGAPYFFKDGFED